MHVTLVDQAAADEVGYSGPLDAVWAVTTEPTVWGAAALYATKTTVSGTQYGYYNTFGSLQECVHEFKSLWAKQ